MICRTHLLLLLFSICLHFSLSPEAFSLCLTDQPLLQSLHFFRALGGHFRSLYTPDIVMILVVGPHDVVAPTEGGREVVHESHVVEIVVISTSPEGKNVLERPREIVSTVSIDGLEETEDDPDVHGEDVEVASAKDIENWTSDCPSTEDEDFRWMGVLSSKTEGGRVLVVNFVDVLVHGTPVKELMSYRTRWCKPLSPRAEQVFTYRRNETCLRKQRKMRLGARYPSKQGRELARCSFRGPRQSGETTKS